jgi:hypothetical protein
MILPDRLLCIFDATTTIFGTVSLSIFASLKHQQTGSTPDEFT